MRFILEKIKCLLKTVDILKLRVALVVFVVQISFVYSQDFPQPTGRLVSDYTNTLSAQELSSLEQKLVAFDDSTSTQIAVVLINSTGDYDVADYAVRLAQKWGVGQAKYNNGIVLLAAIGDRAVTIQTGYGIESALPDAIAYRIIENDIKPAFRQSQYFVGLNQATNSIISYTKGEYKAETKPSAKGNGFGNLGSVILFIIIIVVVALISKKGGGNNNKGGGRMIDGKGSSDLFWWMLLNGMGGGKGSGGGFGGGSSGGGFGGFGGGSFGGGGASGRW